MNTELNIPTVVWRAVHQTILDSNNEVIAEVKSEADLHLAQIIAAAPEMLTALHAVFVYMETKTVAQVKAFDLVHAAIRKAEGR